MRAVLAGTLCVVGAACADNANIVAPTPSAAKAAPVSSIAQLGVKLGDMSRALAIAARDSLVRADLRDAWRGSLLVEHRIAFQDYMTSAAGVRVHRALASALGVNGKALDAALSALPPLQLFVPFNEHRLTWRGTGDLMIGSTTDRHHTPVLTAFDTAGSPTYLRRADGVPAAPLAILVQADPTSRRVAPQAPTAGVVIQDGTDGTDGGVVTMTDRTGAIRTVELADLAAAAGSPQRSGTSSGAGVVSPNTILPCEGDCGGGGVIAPSADTIYVRAFVIFWTWDVEWGGHEVQMDADLYRTTISTTPEMTARYRRDGVNACDRATPPSSASCVAWQSQEPGVPLFIIGAGGSFAKIDINTYEMNVITNDWHGFTEYTTSTIGTWRPMCAYACPPEDGDIFLKRTYHY